ncbi:MAG: GAF domain-containing protein, partial [Cyanobacteriota bacterium]
QLLITDSDSQYLLLIGAYRDNEVSPTHSLILTLEEIEKTGATVNNIVLQPLELGHINQLVADTLQESERSKDLAELVFNKTQGNPFFLTQLLQTFHAEKLVYFDFVEGRWLWDIEQIQAIGITDYSVVELVAKNIQKLSEETQEVLKLAACVGNSFTLDVLAIVNEKSLLDTANDLWEALQSGLILPLSNTYKIPLFFDSSQHGSLVIDDYRISYKFLHDRVQQAAYSLIPEETKKATHLKIGQLLLQKTGKLALEENIFDIVNQLNIGVEFLQNPLEKEELASLNLMAGKKAKMANAYEGAVRYLTVGLELLPENSWQSHYELTLNLHVEAAEAEYLNTDLEGAEILAEVVLQQATNLLDKVKVYELKIQLAMAQLQMLKAVETGLSVLEILGFSPSSLSNEKEEVLQLPALTELENIPLLSNPYQLAALQIFMSIVPPTFVTDPATFVQVTSRMVNLCTKHGHSALAAYVYANYGLILRGGEDINSAYHAGQLALKLLEQFAARSLKSKVYVLFNAYIRHWKEPARETIAPLMDGIQSGLDTGDIEWASYSAFHYCEHVFWVGELLEAVEIKQASCIDLTRKLKQDFSINYIKIFHQVTLNLQGLAEQPSRLVGSSFDETIMVPYFQAAKNGFMLFAVYLAKGILSFLFKDYPQALNSTFLAEEYVAGMMGKITLAGHNFYYSLALLAQYKQATPQEQQQYLTQVEANQQKMQFWALHAAANYQHKYDLVEAEKARVLGDTLLAMELYDHAITGAKNNGYIQEEALANEIAAEFYLACGRINIAKSYMTEAYYGYIRWGAIAKVKDLDERYPQLIFRTPKNETSFLDTTRTTTSSTGSHTAELDLSSVIKASQAISGEIVLENLIDKLMKIVIENAGAQRGCLLARHNNQWVITAQGTVADKEITITHSLIEEIASHFPLSLLNYVERTKQHLVLDNATSTKPFATDPYIVSQQPKSVLCLPIIHQGKLDGILYLENNLTTEAFTSERVKVLKLLTAQASISLENARLYTNLQDYSQKLEAKSTELEVKNVALVASEAREREKAEELKQSLHKLQQTQAQLVHTEKISSLGQLVAGVAHEVNNPVSFIVGNLHHATQHVRDLLSLIDLYAKHLPEPPTEIQDEIEVIELEYLKEDLPKMLSSMQVGTDRIKDIMQSLRNFSRVDEAEKKPADIHSGIESTLMILQHRLKAKKERPAIVVVKEYGKVPPVECYAG